MLTYPAKKDYTDSEIAARYALEHGCDDIFYCLARQAAASTIRSAISICLANYGAGRGGELYDGVTAVWLAKGTISFPVVLEIFYP